MLKFSTVSEIYPKTEWLGSALKSIFLSLYAPITSYECHAWFHLNAASPAARNTEQVNITKNSCPR